MALCFHFTTIFHFLIVINSTFHFHSFFLFETGNPFSAQWQYFHAVLLSPHQPPADSAYFSNTSFFLQQPVYLHLYFSGICISSPFVFLSGQLSRQQGLYLCLLWEPGCLLAFSILAHQHSQRGILILRGQHLFPPKNRKFNEQEVQIYAHSNLHKCPTIQMRLFKCLEIKSIDSVESFSYAAKCIGKQLTASNW